MSTSILKVNSFHSRLARILLACLFLASFICLGFSRAEAQERVVALVGGSVIDGTGKAPQTGSTVLIRGDRIAAVGPKVRIPKGATVINVAGKTIIPGLVDMHGHLYARATRQLRSQFDSYPLLYLAGGVTTVRSPGDFDPEGTVALRDRIRRGEATGPRIFTCGPYFDNAPSQVSWIKAVKTPEEALEKFNQWKGRIDCVKLYTRITEPEFRVVADAARKAGMPVTAHLGSITAMRAIELGATGLEHGIFAMSELAKNNNRGDYCGELNSIDLNSPTAEKLIATIIKKRVVIDPTAIIFEVQLPDFEPVTPDWDKYLSAEAKAYQSSLLSSSKGETDASRCLRKAIQTQSLFVKKLHDRGGILTTGTDPVTPRLIPAYALHREMKFLVDAGLTPVEAIKAATLNAAIGLRREKEMGTIQRGKLADLVVVGGDPSKRIEDVGNTEIVFKGGVQYDPAALRKSAEGKIQ